MNKNNMVDLYKYCILKKKKQLRHHNEKADYDIEMWS